MTKSLLLCIALTVLLKLCSSTEKYDNYLADCWTESSGNEVCHVALFSEWNFNLMGKLYILESDLCEPVASPELSDVLSSKSIIFGVRKGGCSFEDKTRTAELLGAAGLVLINNDPSFPVGLSNADFTSKIPVIMFQSSEKFDQFGMIGSIHLQYELKPQVANKRYTEVIQSPDLPNIDHIETVLEGTVPPLMLKQTLLYNALRATVFVVYLGLMSWLMFVRKL